MIIDHLLVHVRFVVYLVCFTAEAKADFSSADALRKPAIAKLGMHCFFWTGCISC